jgi:hypothetical protein
MTDVKTTKWEGNKRGRKKKKILWTKDMTDVKTTEWEGNKPRRRRKKTLDKGYD